jgi:hypothetical protein
MLAVIDEGHERVESEIAVGDRGAAQALLKA